MKIGKLILIGAVIYGLYWFSHSKNKEIYYENKFYQHCFSRVTAFELSFIINGRCRNRPNGCLI